MGEIFGVLLVFVFFAATFSVMFRGLGARVGRPPRGVLTRFKDPQGSPFFAAALAAYALAKFLAEVGSTFDATLSISIGILMAILVSVRGLQGVTIVGCNGLAVVLAVYEAFTFVKGDGAFVELESLYRVGLMMVVLLSFVLGAFVGRRDSAIAGSRGFALLALVEVSIFLSAPAGRDFFTIDQLGNGVVMLVIAGIGFALGWAVSEYVLGVVVIAIAATAPFSPSFDEADQAALAAAATALVVLFLARPLTKGRRSG